MRVVVVGATGNVGTSLVRRLADEPEVTTIVGLARRRPDWSPAKTQWSTVDVGRDDDLTSHMRGADVVVHLAWLFQPTHDPITTWRVNALGGIRGVRAAVDAGVRAPVYASPVG